jgi:cytoskeletal protein CcmA (bactofilin family)
VAHVTELLVSESLSLDSTEKGILMFNNRKTEGAPISAVSTGGDKSIFGASPNPRNTYKVDPSVHSVVDQFLTMKGDLESEGDIHVKGKVLGNIRCKLLIIDVDALVEGGVEAEEVIVRGNTKGTIQADRVKLEKTANVDSEICHRTFSAEEGARIKGSLRSKDESPGGLTRDVGAKDGARAKLAPRSKEEPLGGQTEAANANSA